MIETKDKKPNIHTYQIYSLCLTCMYLNPCENVVRLRKVCCERFWSVSPIIFQLTNGPVIGSRKRPSEGNYEKEKEHCIALFDQWSEADQVEFVERLISRMCHYQHGHINSYLKPMLQRDFITALPGTNVHQCWVYLYESAVL